MFAKSKHALFTQSCGRIAQFSGIQSTCWFSNMRKTLSLHICTVMQKSYACIWFCWVRCLVMCKKVYCSAIFCIVPLPYSINANFIIWHHLGQWNRWWCLQLIQYSTLFHHQSSYHGIKFFCRFWLQMANLQCTIIFLNQFTIIIVDHSLKSRYRYVINERINIMWKHHNHTIKKINWEQHHLNFYTIVLSVFHVARYFV